MQTLSLISNLWNTSNLSIEMSNNLEPEQSEIIREAIINFLTNKKGIIKFLRERGQVIDY